MGLGSLLGSAATLGLVPFLAYASFWAATGVRVLVLLLPASLSSSEGGVTGV